MALDRAERLLKVGYFPSQLPPAFHTRDLAARYSWFLNGWKALDPKTGMSGHRTR